MKRPVIALLAFVAVVAAACTGGASVSPSAAPSAAVPSASSAASPAASAEAVELTVFGAASLTDVLDTAKTAYEAANPGTTLTISPGSSAALRTQIEEGAPADVFLSADTNNPKTLADAGLLDGQPVNFAGNTLTIITPTDNPAGIASPMDLAKDGVKIIAAGDEVPITKYATQAVANMAGLAGFPPGFAEAYANNIVSREENVRDVVGKLELGEGDAGIVYVTDAKASGKVGTVDIPAEANVPATYAGAVIKASENPAAATAFLDWFAGPDGQAILAEFGFTAPTA
jgi:molybdate transport system substrate-binding protein